MHSGIVPLSGVRGHVAEVTLELPDALTACHIQPVRLSITEEQRNQKIQVEEVCSSVT